MNIRSIIERFKQQATPTPQILLGMEGMAERNAARIEEIKKQMGDKYAHAKAHYVKRLDEPRPV